jgi:signal transduction histidine kinase
MGNRIPAPFLVASFERKPCQPSIAVSPAAPRQIPSFWAIILKIALAQCSITYPAGKLLTNTKIDRHAVRGARMQDAWSPVKLDAVAGHYRPVNDLPRLGGLDAGVYAAYDRTGGASFEIMTLGILVRLILYFTTITLLVVLIAWTAHTSWVRTGELHAQLSAKQWQSFQIADHLQQGVLSLNNLVLRYAAYRDEADWSNFVAASSELGHWFNQQEPILASRAERPFLDRINVAFDDYLAAAGAIHRKIYPSKQSITRVVEFTTLEKRSQHILDLGLRLSEAHQQSIDAAQEQSLQSLNVLRFESLGSLAGLLLAVFWLASVVYRELISPLQVQLVESRQLVERQEKLASLGMLAAGVAHEIRNPLTAIKAWLYLQQKHLTPGTPEYGDAELIGREINRLERIVKDFLQFARPSEPQFTAMPADQPLREVQTLMQPGLEKADIQLVLGEVTNAQIRIDPQQIKQVLINLIQNGADAIGSHGTVTLNARLDEKRLNQRSTDVVVLEVVDTGGGIPPDAEKRLFDPFFTTKDFGTGLGLPIAARIVEKNHGALQYQTQLERGTTFGIILPLHES